MVDRSDLIAASVYSRKLSRDFSNSSLRERRGSEVSRLQNRSGCPHHSLGLSCMGIRPLLPKTGHGSARTSTEASGPLQSMHRVPSPSTYWASPWLRWRASDHRPRQRRPPSSHGRERGGRGGPRAAAPQPIPTSVATDGSTGDSATATAGVDAGVGNKSAGLEATTASAASPGMMAAPTGGQPGRLAPWQFVPPGPLAGGRLVRRPTNRHGAPQHRLQRPTPS
jgi:hypothetical protein